MMRTITQGPDTVQYPKAKEAPPIRARGVIALHEGNCTVCMLCARSCPDWCIMEHHGEHVTMLAGTTPKKRPVKKSASSSLTEPPGNGRSASAIPK